MHLLSITAMTLLSAAIAAQGSPLPPSTIHRRAATKLHILTTGAEACDAAAVTSIKDGVADAKKLAALAIKKLKSKDMQSSNGFFQLFGGSSVVTTAKISKRFDFVTALGVPNEVTSLDTVGGNENVIFTCIPASHPKANEAYANTKNNQKLPAPAGGEAPQPVNLIRFTPRGLQNTESSAESIARMKASSDIGKSAFVFDGEFPLPFLAFSIIHELQHSIPLVDGVANQLKDQVDFEGERAYGLQQVQEMDPAKKPENPQNYAWFALLSVAKPELFDASAKIDGSKIGAKPKTRSLDLFRRLFARVTKSKPKAKVTVKPAAKPVKVPAKKVAAAPPKPKPSASKKVATQAAPKRPAAKAPVRPVTKAAPNAPVKPTAPKKVSTKPVTKVPAPKKVSTKPAAKVSATKKVPTKAAAKPPITPKKSTTKSPSTSKKVPTKAVKGPVKKPTIPVKKPVASKAASAVPAKPSASAKAAAPKKIPGSDVKFLDFEGDFL